MEDSKVNSEINRADKQGPFNILFLKLLLIFSPIYLLCSCYFLLAYVDYLPLLNCIYV